MRHKGTQTIETSRLILRQFRPEDAEAAYRNWMSDERVTRYLRWPAHTDPALSRKVVEEWTAAYEAPDFYQWAIELKALGEPIGSISVVEQNEQLDILHIGYCIGARWWRQGITSEAFAAILPFLFDEVGANRIEAQHDPNNPHSGHVMQKCGLTYEGTLRQADFNNQGIVDACMYSILRSEWELRRG